MLFDRKESLDIHNFLCPVWRFFWVCHCWFGADSGSANWIVILQPVDDDFGTDKGCAVAGSILVLSFWWERNIS